MSINRKAIRLGVYNMLNGNVPSSQAIYSYLPHSFNHQSPVICLTSSGTNRVKLTNQGYAPIFYVNVHIFVSYGSATDDSWTESQAEDGIDTIESEIAEAFLNKDGPTNADGIDKLSWQDRSFADEPVQDSGETYLHEIIPLVIKAAK